MSTGDQSDYIRGKVAVRGRAALEQAPKFMQDGFDRWADKTEVGSGGRMMDLPQQQENTGGRRKKSSYLKGLILDGGAANPDSSQAIARYSKELADKGLRLAIKKNKKILAGKDAEADEEAFNQALQEWQDYYFGLPKELQKFASQGSEDLAAESEELQNRVDRFLFDQRQKKLREERDLTGNAEPSLAEMGSEVPVKADVDEVLDVVDSAKGYANAFGISNFIPDGIKKGAEKAVELGKKVKSIATDARKLLQTPAVVAKAEASFPGFGKVGVNAISDFMELVGFGRFKDSKKVISMVKRSKPFKQYSSGKFPETVDAFRKYASKRKTAKSPAELKQILQKQMEDVRDFASEYTGSAALKSGLKRQKAIRNLTKAPGVATKTWAETWAEWSKWIVDTYLTLEAKAPIVISAFESPAMTSLIKTTPAIKDKEIGKKIANVTRVIFPEASKKVKPLDDKKDAPAEAPAEAPATGGAGVQRRPGGFNIGAIGKLVGNELFNPESVLRKGKGLDKSLGLEYYLNRIKTLENAGHMTKAEADAKRKEYREFFKSGGASCCRGCDGGGMCEGKGGRKPSAYAQFVKQFAAKNPGPNLMKRAAEAWRSHRKMKGSGSIVEFAANAARNFAKAPITNTAGLAVSSLAGDRRKPGGITPGIVSNASVQQYARSKGEKMTNPWYDIAKLAENEFTNPTSDLAKAFGVKQPEPQVAQAIVQENLPPHIELINLWVTGELDDVPFKYVENMRDDTPTNRSRIYELFVMGGLNPSDKGAKQAEDFFFSDYNRIKKANEDLYASNMAESARVGQELARQGIDLNKGMGKPRKPSAYAQFVKQYAAKHPGPDLMKRAAAAWKSQK